MNNLQFDGILDSDVDIKLSTHYALSTKIERHVHCLHRELGLHMGWVGLGLTI